MATKLCECGCGNPTRIAVFTDRRNGQVGGKPLQYINGHNRTHPIKTPEERLVKTPKQKKPKYIPRPPRKVICKFCGVEWEYPKKGRLPVACPFCQENGALIPCSRCGKKTLWKVSKLSREAPAFCDDCRLNRFSEMGKALRGRPSNRWRNVERVVKKPKPQRERRVIRAPKKSLPILKKATVIEVLGEAPPISAIVEKKVESRISVDWIEGARSAKVYPPRKRITREFKCFFCKKKFKSEVESGTIREICNDCYQIQHPNIVDYRRGDGSPGMEDPSKMYKFIKFY